MLSTTLPLAPADDRSRSDDGVPPHPQLRILWRPWVASAVWLMLAVTGTALMVEYSQTAGAAAKAPGHWPGHSQLPLNADRMTLVMFVHPHCPCSRATLGELDRLMAAVGDRMAGTVVFVKPEAMTGDWVESSLWRQASRIPGVQMRIDDGGAEALRFDARTSGWTLLYEPDGALMFQGGITPARGHAGDSAGRSAILEILKQRQGGVLQAPVFGCELCESQAEP